MSIEQRLAALEKTRTKPGTQPVTHIEVVDEETGEVVFVHCNDGTSETNARNVMAVLRYKHETDPPRKVRSRIAENEETTI